jgi:alkaline phosphatase D
MGHVGRRTFVLGVLAVAAAAAVSAPLPRRRPSRSYPFQLGVASGEPGATSVVLWTRLAREPLAADGHGGMPDADVTVQWQVSATESFAAVAAAGVATARHADAHSVHVVAHGLRPDAEYFYRFRSLGDVSPVARTRTAPAPGTVGPPLAMAFVSCANWESGYYTAYRRLAEDQPSLILHLGDYIYENAPVPGAVRRHDGDEAVTLADYRRRYAQYKTDPDLQAAHVVAPWVVVPDDHEVEDNYAGLVRADDYPHLDAGQFRARRAAAYRAYYEHMPLRPANAPRGDGIALYRRIRWGRLATFHMLDTRQFRDDQACGDLIKVCPDADRPGRTITGAAQEAWLLDGLGRHLGVWDVLGQQVFFAGQHNAAGAGNMDSWEGYRAARDRLQRGWVARHVRNPVVLTGDVHQSWAADLKADYADPESATIGAELVCTSISTGGDGTGSTVIPDVAVNPHLRFFSDRRGYVRTRITADHLQADFRAVDRISRPGAAVRTAGSFRLEPGRAGLITP